MIAIRKKFEKLDLNDELSIVITARKGVRPGVFYTFAGAVKMPEKELASLLHLHPRTISNYKNRQQKLDPVEAEHLLKLIALYMKGEEIFGELNEFSLWLQKNSWINNDKPMDLLNTPGGVDLVSAELDRLAHGYPV